METITFDNDIKVLYVKAVSFPDGIMEAYNKLHSMVPSGDRKFYGISRPERGIIEYKAAVEEHYQGEAEKLKCETMILKNGKYISLTINDYAKDMQSFGRAFSELLTNPAIDPEGYCVEWYFNDKDVKCMIRLKE